MSVNPYMTPTFKEWASYMTPSLERFGPVPFPPEEDGWKNWADVIVSLNFGAPIPQGFRMWREWGARLIEVLNDGF